VSTPRKEKTATTTAPEKPVNQGRHEAQCTICSHAKREEIEQEFVGWKSPDKIAKKFRVCRDSIYRHARAFDLVEPRRRNVRAALERIIEKAGDVPVNAAAIVSAVATYSKLNSNGQWIERTETVNMVELFKRMTRDELRAYADRGELPLWFTSVVGATGGDSQEAEGERQAIEG
jgi:hypothetical protein